MNLIYLMGDNLNSFVAFFFTFVAFCSILSLPANRYKCLQMSTKVEFANHVMHGWQTSTNLYKRLQIVPNGKDESLHLNHI